MPESACRGCALTFTSVSAFDCHQRRIDVRPFVECRKPADVGLVARVRERAGKRRTVWGWPGRDEEGDAA